MEEDNEKHFCKRQRRSKVWKHFKLKRNGNTVECVHCKTELSYHHSTTSMQNHLNRKHPLFSTSLRSDSTTSSPQTCLDSFVRAVAPCSSEQAAELTDSILNMFIKDMRPLSMVEDDGFQKMMLAFNPRYTLPSRTSLTKMMEKKHEEVKIKLKKILEETDSIALTTDIWTSVATESYLGVTCHIVGTEWEVQSFSLTTMPLEERHTSANIAEWLEDVIAKFEIPPEKVKAVVHDNGANVVAAAMILSEKHGWASVCCAGHTLNLIVQSALQNHQVISKCVATSRCLVEHFNKSELDTTKLKLKQEEMSTPHHMLIQDVCTHWNSTYHMLSRILEQRWPITAALSDPTMGPRGKHHHHLDLKPEQWNVIQELCQALRPFEEATVFLSGQKYVTLSVLPHLVQSLKKSIQSSAFDTLPVRSFQDHVTEQMNEQWQGFFVSQPEKQNAVLLAAFLDPRFIKLKFLPAKETIKVQSAIQSMVLAVKQKIMEQSGSGTSKTSPGTRVPRCKDATSFLNHLMGSSSDSSSSDEEDENQQLSKMVQKEVLMYLGEHPPSKKENPLSWWKSNAQKYPNLAKVAKSYLCIPATSTLSECLFSAAGNIASKRRASLSSEHIDMLTFLHYNQTLL